MKFTVADSRCQRDGDPESPAATTWSGATPTGGRYLPAQSYHGPTMETLALTGRAGLHGPFRALPAAPPAHPAQHVAVGPVRRRGLPTPSTEPSRKPARTPSRRSSANRSAVPRCLRTTPPVLGGPGRTPRAAWLLLCFDEIVYGRRTRGRVPGRATASHARHQRRRRGSGAVNSDRGCCVPGARLSTPSPVGPAASLGHTGRCSTLLCVGLKQCSRCEIGKGRRSRRDHGPLPLAVRSRPRSPISRSSGSAQSRVPAASSSWIRATGARYAQPLQRGRPAAYRPRRHPSEVLITLSTQPTETGTGDHAWSPPFVGSTTSSWRWSPPRRCRPLVPDEVNGELLGADRSSAGEAS